MLCYSSTFVLITSDLFSFSFSFEFFERTHMFGETVIELALYPENS